MELDGQSQRISSLRARGYSVTFTEAAYCSCLLESAEEAFVGVGSSPSRALDDALRRALPTALAHALWTEAYSQAREAPASPDGDAAGAVYREPEAPAAGATASPPDDALALTVAVEPPASQAELQGEPQEATEASPQEAAAACNLLDTAQSDAPMVDFGVAESAPAHAFEVDAGGDAYDDADDAPPPAPWRTLRTLPEFREFIADTAELIDIAAPQLALLPPQTLLVQLVVWLARVRAVQLDLASDEAFQLANREVIHRLRCLVGELWPGRLDALRHHTYPSKLRGILGQTPSSWTEAADLAERLLEEGLPGWADHADDHAPAQPDALVAEAMARLDDLLGADARPNHPGCRRAIDEVVCSPDLFDALTTVARRLRWARPYVLDGAAWGRQFGRLRWVLERHLPQRPQGLVAALDPQYGPLRSWAHELGLDLQTQARSDKRLRLQRSLPTVSQEVEALAAWFHEAAACFDAPELADLLAPHADVFCRIAAPERYPGKSLGTVRSRFTSVCKRLESKGAASADAMSRPAPPQPDAVTIDAEAIVAVELTAVSEVEAKETEQARARVIGLRALVVGNRADPTLESTLIKRFGLKAADFCDGTKLRVLNNACERVRSGSVDVVLLVTGFIGHTVEQMVRKAAKGRQIGIVRADKGRPGQMARAILRDLGPRQAEAAARSGPGAPASA